MRKVLFTIKYGLLPALILISLLFGNRYGLIPFAHAIDCPEQDCNIQIPDVPTCLNDNEQSIPIPDGQEADVNGFCIDIDVCPNIDDNQLEAPTGYYISDKTGDCEQLPQQDNPQVLGASIQTQLSNK